MTDISDVAAELEKFSAAAEAVQKKLAPAFEAAEKLAQKFASEFEAVQKLNQQQLAPRFEALLHEHTALLTSEPRLTAPTLFLDVEKPRSQRRTIVRPEVKRKIGF